jgi:hypothetical protein
MERKTLKEFHRNLTWQSRIYTVVVISTVIFAHVFKAWENNWVTTIIGVAALVLFLDSFNVAFHRHPRIWRLVKWLIILLALAILLVGLQPLKL